jgi:hypothetical protein
MCQRCWGKAVPPRPEDLWRRTLNALEYAKGVLAESEAELDRLCTHNYPDHVIAFRASIVRANRKRVDELDAAFRKLDEGEDKQS